MKEFFARLFGKSRMSKSPSRSRRRFTFNSRQMLLLVTALCALMIALSIFDESRIAPVRFLANYTVVPMEKGLNRIGNWISNQSDYFKSVQELERENKLLKTRVEALTEENQQLKESRFELDRLSALYETDSLYPDYEKISARVIGRSGGNWFSQFTIDKGANDGIKKDMNVLASGGLAGVVIEVGPNWATVRSVIDDYSKVSAMTASGSDICYVEGSLDEMESGTISFTEMENNENEVRVGDTLITSHVSSKFLPGIIIGYISDIHIDSNNLTRSGRITPAVDFKHLQEVLVITTLKEDLKEGMEEGTEENPEEDRQNQEEQQ